MCVFLYNRVIHVFYVKRASLYDIIVHEPDRLNRGDSHIMYKTCNNRDRISNCIRFMERVPR